VNNTGTRKGSIMK